MPESFIYGNATMRDRVRMNRQRIIDLENALAGVAEQQKTIGVASPDVTTDHDIFFTNKAITITEMRAAVTGTAPDITWTVRHHADRDDTGNEVVTGGTQTTDKNTGSDVTVFDDATVAADSFLWLETPTVASSPDVFSVTVFYTVDG